MHYDNEKVEQIVRRLRAVEDKKPWVYNSEHPMFIGSSHAIEMYSRTLDLGRGGYEYELSTDPKIKGHVATKQSIKRVGEIKALGEFISCSREDIRYLLNLMGHGDSIY